MYTISAFKINALVKDISKSLLLSLLIGLIYLVYVVLVGIPRTKARELYNLGVVEHLSGNLNKSITKLTAANKVWPEEYITNFKTEVQHQQDIDTQ